MLESPFRTKLKAEITTLFPDCMIIDTDPSKMQGLPDIIILNGKSWAALETKKNKTAKRQPNQPYYVSMMNDMSYAAFVSPENKEEVLNELQRSFAIGRVSRISRPK